MSEPNLLIPLTHTSIFLDPVTTPVLNISAFQTETARYITLRCISYNGSLPINYTFFEKDVAISPAISKNVREPAEFNLTERITGEREEYRCKAKNRLPNHAKYSQPFTMPSTGKGCLSSFNRVWICFQKLQLLLCPPTFHFGHLLPNAFSLVGSTQTLMGLLSSIREPQKSLEAGKGMDLVVDFLT